VNLADVIEAAFSASGEHAISFARSTAFAWRSVR